MPDVQAYSAISFITNPSHPSQSLAAYFGVPGVAETFRKNGTWRLIETGAGVVYWEGFVAADGTLLPPGVLPENSLKQSDAAVLADLPPGFPTFTSPYGYDGFLELQIDYIPDPTRPCGCPNQNQSNTLSCPAGADSGKSVELLSGRFRFDLPLLDIKAPGNSGWNFGLHYFADFGIDGILGKNFNYPQFTYLNELATNEFGGGHNVELVSSNNTRSVFAYDAFTGQYSSDDNNTGAILKRSGSGIDEEFTLYAADGTVTVFDGFDSAIATPGQMKSITDRFGNVTTYQWQSVADIPQLVTQTDAYGRPVHYRYYGSEFGYRVREIEDFLGRKLNFQYDADGQLLAVVTPSIERAVPGNTFPGGTAYVFEYDTRNPRPQRRDDLIRIWYPNQTQPFLDEDTRTVDVEAVYREATPRYTVQYGQDPTDANSYGKVLTETVGDPDPGGNVGGTFAYEYITGDLPENIIDNSHPITHRTVMVDRNGNRTIYDFNDEGMTTRHEVQNNRGKSSLEAESYVTWTKYNAQNQPVLVVHPEGNSTEYTYDSGNVPGIGIYAPRRGLLLSQTQLPGNTLGLPARSGSNGQTRLTQRLFHDPLFNQVCAGIDPCGNPIDGSTYFTPQNGGSTPTDADRSRYASINYFDYQQNTDSTIVNNATLQQQLGLNSSQIQALLNYVDSQMKATDGSGGIPAGFPRNLGDINGDGTGDGDSSGLPAARMAGNVVKVQHPAVRQLVPNPAYPGSGDEWEWQQQQRVEVFTNNDRGQLTTQTDAEGNVTAYVRYPENDPDGNGMLAIPFLSNKQYGQVKEVHVDINPHHVMSLIGEDGDLLDFTPVIERTNTPGIYQDLVTRYEGAPDGSGGCSSCAYDPLGNPLAVTDARGFTTVYERNELGVEYRRIAPAPYLTQIEKYFDANGNIIREDTEDQQVAFLSEDPTDPNYAKFFPSGFAGNAGTEGEGPANLPLKRGAGGEIRPGWFTNLYRYDLLDNKIEDDIDASGSQPASLVTKYQYDANENLVKITKPNGNTEEYDYDERDQRIAQRLGYIEPDEFVSPPPGSTTVWVYDGNGNLKQTIGPAQRGTVDQSLTVIIRDAFGSGQALEHTGDYQTEIVYDGFDRLIRTIDAAGNVSHWEGDIEEPALSPTGQQLITTRQGPVGGAIPSNRLGNDNVDLSINLARYDEAHSAYERQNQVFLVTGKSGGNPIYTLPSSRTVTHTGGGLEANSTSNGHTGTVTLTTGEESYTLTRIVYDRAGRISAIAQDNSAIVSTVYDGANRAIEQTDALDNVTKSTFDGNGNVIFSLRTEKASFSEEFTEEIIRSANRYDALNRLILNAVQGANGNIRADLNECCTWPVQSTSLVTLYGYDSRGNQTVSIDPNGNTAINEYDGADRLLETIQHLRQNGEGNGAPLTNESFNASGGSTVHTQHRYDANGNRIQIVDDRGGTTTYEYDEQDRLIMTIQHDGSRKTKTYDLASDITQITDENGSVFNNVYDVLGREITVNITRASGIQGTTQQSYQYDGLSRPTWHRDTSGSNTDGTIYHDSLSRVVEENQGGRYATSNAFTSLRGSELTYPNDRKVNTIYDVLYRNDEIKESSDNSRIAKWHYVGNRTAEVLLGNGLIQTFLNNERTHSQVQPDVPNPAWGSADSNRLGYDGSGRAITKRYLDGGIHSGTGAYNDTMPVVGFTTEYDHAGNKMYERELHAENRSNLYQSFNEQGYSEGGYDSLNRLRKALRGELSSTGGYLNAGGGSIVEEITLPNTDQERFYDLDGLGNWIQSDYIPVGGTPTIDLRQHNKLNEITSRKIGADSKTNFSYDANGNLKDDGILLYGYDALNRLTEVRRKSDNQIIGQYVYDAQNRRVRKTISNGGLTTNVPNVTIDFVYRNWQVMQEINNSSTVAKQYVWGNYIDECIQLRTYVTSGAGDLAAGLYYPLQDLLYRTQALTNANGEVAEAYDYDAYGNTLIFSVAGTGSNWWADDAIQAGYAACEVLYTGYRYDAESETYQVRNRQYNPVLSRWIQRDPIGFESGDWNLYKAFSNSPLNFSDPSGLIPKPSDPEYDPLYHPYVGGPPPTNAWPTQPSRFEPKYGPEEHFIPFNPGGETNITSPIFLKQTVYGPGHFKWFTTEERCAIVYHERFHREQQTVWYLITNPRAAEYDAWRATRNYIEEILKDPTLTKEERENFEQALSDAEVNMRYYQSQPPNLFDLNKIGNPY